jgi:kynurenine formamidase
VSERYAVPEAAKTTPGCHAGDSVPSNWQRWGPDDEVGALNYLGNAEVLAAAREVRAGRVFTLGIELANPLGDPVWPGRPATARYPIQDHGSYLVDQTHAPRGDEFADDVLILSTHGTTHCDALGHVWTDNELYNGYSADNTIDRMRKASILPIAKRGIVGRVVLVDIARARQKPRLARGEAITLRELREAIDLQGSSMDGVHILLVRTGWLPTFYRDRSDIDARPLNEPGLQFSDELTRWFADSEISVFGTDTLGNELTIDPEHGQASLLHINLMRNLGVVFTEMLWLDDLAEYCAKQRRWTGCFVAAPLKVNGGTGAPVNPMVMM